MGTTFGWELTRVGEMTPRLTAGQPEAGVPDEREEAGGARRAGRVPGQDD